MDSITFELINPDLMAYDIVFHLNVIKRSSDELHVVRTMSR